MTSDVRDLFRAATPEPRRPLDVAVLVQTANRRRRRRRVLAGSSALLAVVVLAGGVAALTRVGTNHEINAGGVPPGGNPAAGVTVTLPTAWMDLPRVTNGYPREILVIGTAARPGEDPIRACTTDTPPPLGSVYVSLYEYTPENPSFALPGGDGMLSPESFRTRGPDGSIPRLTGSTGCAPQVPATQVPGARVPASQAASPTATSQPVVPGSNRFDYAAFRDANRIFLARIVSSDDPTGQLLQSGYNVLRTLRVDPPTTSSSGALTTLPPSSTLPKPTGPPPADQAAARQAILDAYRGAFGGGGPISHGAAIEGGDPNNAATEQSAATANPNLVNTITPRINWLVFLDQTRAELNFDLLVNNQPVTANTTGQAIVENGHWRITRATYCEILHRGGTPCPG